MTDLTSATSAEQTVRAARKLELLTLRVSGMTCPHCPQAIEAALKALPGVKAAHVNLVNRLARIEYDPAPAQIRSILHAIRSLGYATEAATTRLLVKNMHCGSCGWLIELALQSTPGVLSARASLGPNAVDVEYDPEKVDFDGIRQAIYSAGYGVAEPEIAPQGEVDADIARSFASSRIEGTLRRQGFLVSLKPAGRTLALENTERSWETRINLCRLIEPRAFSTHDGT